MADGYTTKNKHSPVVQQGSDVLIKQRNTNEALENAQTSPSHPHHHAAMNALHEAHASNTTH